MTLKLKSGGVTSTPPYVVDKGLPALIAFAASAGTMPSKNAAPNTMACSAVSILRDSKNEMKKNRKYPDERNRFRQSEIDRQANQEADQPGQEQAVLLPLLGKEQPGCEIACHRTHHHGWRHRIACLGRIDHQVGGEAAKSGGE